MWTIMTANISKEVEFVRHGIEEAAGELISRLKPRIEFKELQFFLFENAHKKLQFPVIICCTVYATDK